MTRPVDGRHGAGMAQEQNRYIPPAKLVITAVFAAACVVSAVAWVAFDTGTDFWASAFWFCVVFLLGTVASMCVFGFIGAFVSPCVFGVLMALMILL